MQVFNELEGNTWSSLAQLRSCIGDVDGDADNVLMEAEMKRQRGNTETGEVRAQQFDGPHSLLMSLGLELPTQDAA